jgi:hypothetical protein
LAAFFLADFSVGFFLGALFAARLELVLAPPDLRAAAFFFAGLRAACFLPRAFVVRPAAALRPAFFFAVLAAVDRLAAFFFVEPLLERFDAFFLVEAVLDRFNDFAAFLRFAAIVRSFVG